MSALLSGAEAASGMSLNQLIVKTEGRGFFLVMVFACLPFVVPISLPGVSTFMGAIVGVLSLRMAMGKPPRLPRFLGERTLKPQTTQKIVRASLKFLRLLEKLVRPRRTKWLRSETALFFNGLLLALMALLLALPVPPVVLFTNSLPSYAIILLAVGIMEEDGVVVWLGYLMALATIVYFALMGGVVSFYLVKWIEYLINLFGAGT